MKFYFYTELTLILLTYVFALTTIFALTTKRTIAVTTIFCCIYKSRSFSITYTLKYGIFMFTL